MLKLLTSLCLKANLKGHFNLKLLKDDIYQLRNENIEKSMINHYKILIFRNSTKLEFFRKYIVDFQNFQNILDQVKYLELNLKINSQISTIFSKNSNFCR